MQPDIDRLREVCKWIRNHPERHRQEAWAYREPMEIDRTPHGLTDSLLSVVRWYRDAYPASTVTLEMLETGTSCGTGLCAAGTAALLAGAEVVFTSSSDTANEVRTPGGELRHIREFATEWLGLNAWQADWFFEANNTIDGLEAMVDRLEASEGNRRS